MAALSQSMTRTITAEADRSRVELGKTHDHIESMRAELKEEVGRTVSQLVQRIDCLEDAATGSRSGRESQRSRETESDEGSHHSGSEKVGRPRDESHTVTRRAREGYGSHWFNVGA